MKPYIKLLACACATTLLAASCKKKDTTTPTINRWVKTYNSVTLGDDENTAEGQFLNTKTGQVIKLASAVDSIRSQLSLLYYVEEAGSNAYLTAPANLAGEDAYYPNSKGPIYTTPGVGLEAWSSSVKNSMELYKTNMTASAFDQLVAAGTWDNFNTTFKQYNSGDADLSYTLNSQLNPGTGDVYLIELNGALRLFAEVISVSDSPTSGFIRMKIVIEGRDDMPSAGKPLMPAE